MRHGDSPKPPNHSQPYPRADAEVSSGEVLQAERRVSIHWASQLPTVWSRGRSLLGAPGADPQRRRGPVPKENGHQPLGHSAWEVL